jgi:hypothetical protein
MSNSMRTIMSLLESRREGDPNVSYTLAGSTKGETAAGEFSKITATLKGRTSEEFTKAVQKFKQADDLAKKATDLRNQANDETKALFGTLFDETDSAYTRYLETVSTSVSWAKATPQSTKITSTLNTPKLIELLEDALDKDLLPLLRSLIDQATDVTTKTSAERIGALKVKDIKPSKTKPVKEGIGDNIQSLVSRLKSWSSKKINSLNSKIDAINREMAK